MSKNNFTYMLIGVAVVAVGVSVILYATTQKHQATAPTAVVEPAISSTSGKAAPVAVQSNKKASPTTPTPKPVTPTSAPVAPAKPAPVVTQTPATPPVPPAPPATPISLPYDVDNFSHKDSWQAILGSVSSLFVDGPHRYSLLAVASTTSTDGIAELAGSEGWTDYEYTLNTNFISGPAFSLIGRYADNKNYVKCIFSEGGVTRIDTVINGKTATVAQDNNQIPTIPHVADVDYALKVKGDNVQCLVNGSPVSATIKNLPSVGGIGIDVYNSTPGSSALHVTEIHVTSL